MEDVLLARWQFGITTVYHWLFVPITLGITWMVAIMETAWVRTKKPEYLRMTKFSKLSSEISRGRVRYPPRIFVLSVNEKFRIISIISSGSRIQ